jgi:hypothetical protein
MRCGRAIASGGYEANGDFTFKPIQVRIRKHCGVVGVVVIEFEGIRHNKMYWMGAIRLM